MWNSFWPDLIIALIGALFTVAIAYGTYCFEQRRTELGALRELINDIHHRRSVADFHPKVVPDARDLPDFQWAGMSVVEIKDIAKRTKNHARPDSKVQATLSSMVSACNRYLEESEISPDCYQYLLGSLRTELTECMAQIAHNRKGIEGLEAGGAAYESPIK